MGYIKAISKRIDCNPYKVEQKCWVIPAIGMGVSLATSLFGGAQASRAARAAERAQRAREASEAAAYTRRYNEDVTDRASGQNLMRKAQEYAKNQWKKASGAQAVAGGTAASAQMAKEAGNRLVGDTLSNLKAMDDARKDRIDMAHEASLDRFTNLDMQREAQRANAIAGAAGAASNAIMQGVSALTPNLKGGSNAGTSSSK